MNRFLIALVLCFAMFGLSNNADAQYIKIVGGYINAGQTVTFFPRDFNNSANDTLYKISGSLNVAGTLRIMEGAEVHFLPNSRIVDSAGGKIIANGFTGQNRRILFRGEPVNQNSFEWGHMIALPGADSVFFANVRFVNFRKRTTVDNSLIYGGTGAALTNSLAINTVVNGVGAVLATFAQKTYLYDIIVDSCQAAYRGGAFAFLQAPAASYVPGDDGRIALAQSHVRRLTVRDTRVFDQEATDPNALGGAIYMASNNESQTFGNYQTAYLGNRPGPFFAADQDVMLFERCTANNPNTGATQVAKGGAIYVGSNTGLIISQNTYNTNSAISPTDANAWGGAIAVSPTSGNPALVLPGVGIVPGTDRLPGLSVIKTSTFTGNVAGLGGAIHLDFTSGSLKNPVLNIDGENMNTSTGVRDSGLILFNDNVAYLRGGALFTSWNTFITGYLAPQNFAFGTGSRGVELRVKFMNNVAGEAGGSICLNTFNNNSNPDIVNRRVWHLNNSVNPRDARVNRPQYALFVQGGGAEYVGLRDSTFATEYTGNTVYGGNGGAVCMVEPQGGIGATSVNRYFVENGYNAQDVTISPYPTDPRELTRFCNNMANLGSTTADSTTLVTNALPNGRGGAIFINITNKTNPFLAQDSTYFSRVRIEKNQAFSGSAIYSDNYDLRLLANLCLIANNHTTSPVALNQEFDGTVATSNPADENASATIWGDFEGPLPSYESNSRGNAIYDNIARYILRLPVSPIIGQSGTDTLRGNFWGDTGPNVITQINPPFGSQQSTFFLDYYAGCFDSVYEPNRNPPAGYKPVAIGEIPDTLLMEGRVYDIYDRGTDMKAADYNNRRLAPAEAFALGLPSDIVKLHRYTRDIFSTDPTYINKIDLYQTDFVGPHPIGYPLFLQADVSAADSNRDDCAKNYSVLMVFNQTTGEFVRVNAKETVADEGTSAQQIYQGRLDFVPDSSVATRHPSSRQKTLYTLSLLRPQTQTFYEVQRAAKLEDSAALDGREYTLAPSQFAGSTPGDSICTQGIAGTSTWYAGERYHTLPVRPGDNILVISRTQLWKYGPSYAISNGLQFTIGDVLPPAFVSDIQTLSSDPINPNRRFLREDENYDSRDAAHTLFRVGGYDVNGFYDPRFLFNPGNYTQLAFNVTYDLKDSVFNTVQNKLVGDTNSVRLFQWLKQTTIYNQNVTGSNGYVLLSGQPHNPDVVPSGEGVTATVTNFPPNFSSENGLLNAFDSSILGANRNNLSEWVFPPYMNCATGFLPDTLCVRPTTSTYHFRIFVQDSLPFFTSTPSTACAANLTDSLRYTYDVNTDDEAEDNVAEGQNWDFRYGRTSYRFLSQPQWLNGSAADTNFTKRGIINVRIPYNEAIALLTPNPQVNGELNLDTIIAVEAHDGHTGKAVQKWSIPVNVSPVITTTSLPDAKEGVDYSLNFRDLTQVNQIKITDANSADYHTYQLLYLGDTMTVYRDGKFGIGPVLLTGQTPRWLHIDPFSGVLSGTPSMNDAPHTATSQCAGADSVVVIVSDQCQLMAWATLPLNVDSVNHSPAFIRGPHSLCVTNRQQFCDSVHVYDADLLRTGLCTDTLQISVLSPASGFTVSPTTIGGTVADTTLLSICGSFNKDDNYFNTNPLIPDTIRLAVHDMAGNADTISYVVHIGDVPTFECSVDISNLGTSTHPTDIQHLCFGAGRFGTDSLDARYCEFEVPPPGPAAVFDARWELPIGGSIKGTYVDIRRDTNQSANITWQIRLNAGNESGTFLYPLTICWSASCFDTMNGTFKSGNFYLRHPQTPGEFSINMKTGLGPVDNSLYTLEKNGSGQYCLQIRDINLQNAIIVFQPALSGVETSTAPATQFALEQNFPNPFNPSTTLNFTVAKHSDVRIDIYDMKGALVRTLVNEDLEPGQYPVTWDATDANGQEVSTGTYIAKMTAGSFSSTVKMTLKK